MDLGSEQPRDAEAVGLPLLLAGLLVATLSGLAGRELAFPAGADPLAGSAAIGVTVLTAWCWLTRCIPLGAASLLPLALFPLLSVSSTKEVAVAYADPILWLFFGGFVLSIAIERWGLHRRIALHVIAAVGMRPRRLVLGFLASATLVSMWINNTATALMLLPIGLALVHRVREAGLLQEQQLHRLTVAVLLGIAYGSSIGGMGTPIGTAPNLLYLGEYAASVDRDEAPVLSFPLWIFAMLPIVAVFAVATWAMLVFFTCPLPAGDPRAGAALREELHALPRMSTAERRVLWLFAITVLLWVTRKDMPLGDDLVLRGWAWWLGFTGPARDFVDDGSVAVLMAVVAFFVPSRRGGPALMDWASAQKLPFDILFLLGGGIAIATALKSTGTCDAIAAGLRPFVESVHPFLAVVLTVTMLTFMTEVTSNTAITALMLPVLSATAIAADTDPRLLMLPATLAASCAFMLPIGTPPNAVVFSSGLLRMGEMARIGLWLNLVSVVLLSLATWFWLVPLLGIQPEAVPGWWRR